MPSIQSFSRALYHECALRLASPTDGLQFSLILSTTHNLIIIHLNVVCFPTLCCCICLTYILCGGEKKTTFRFLLSKNPLTDILVEILMGLAVNMCDEFSMFNRKSSQIIYRYFDILIFDIVVLMLSNYRCNPIILKSIFLYVGFLDTVLDTILKILCISGIQDCKLWFRVFTLSNSTIFQV